MEQESIFHGALSVAAFLIAARIFDGLSPENSLKKGMKLLLGGVLIMTLLAPIPHLAAAWKEKKPPSFSNPVYERPAVQEVLESLVQTVEQKLARRLEQEGCPAEEIQVVCRENEKGQWEIASVSVKAAEKRAEITAVLLEETGVTPIFLSP